MAKQESNQVLRDIHTRGKRALEKRKQREHQDEGVHGILASLGAETRAEKNRLMEARKFARLYKGKRLDSICRLGQKKGRPLTEFHVRLLIRVANGAKRYSLAKKCAEQSWSVRRLEKEIRLILPRRTYGGQRLMPPKSVDDALVVTERLAAGWLRWVKVLKPVNNGESKKRITFEKLPGPIRARLAAISKSAEKLGKEIEKKLNRKSSKPRKRSRRRLIWRQTPACNNCQHRLSEEATHYYGSCTTTIAASTRH